MEERIKTGIKYHAEAIAGLAREIDPENKTVSEMKTEVNIKRLLWKAEEIVRLCTIPENQLYEEIDK